MLPAVTIDAGCVHPSPPMTAVAPPLTATGIHSPPRSEGDQPDGRLGIIRTDLSAGVLLRQEQPLVSVVIVNYRVRDMLRDSLLSLRASKNVDLEIWVVDNASGDGSLDMLSGEFPEVRVIANGTNVGFARANNQALAKTTGDWLVLLNPDTRFAADAMRAIVDVFSRHPRAGCVGAALLNSDGSPQPCCHAFPTLWNLLVEAFGLHRVALRLGIGGPIEAPVPRGGEGAVDWVGGACMTLSREAYRHVGGLNESSFMYGEEMDWSRRAARAGYATVHSDRVRVTHYGGAAGAGIEGALFVRNIEARVAFMRREHGAFQAVLARECMTFGVWLRWIYWRLRAVLDRKPQSRTQVQLERFGAVLAWRRSGSR